MHEGCQASESSRMVDLRTCLRPTASGPAALSHALKLPTSAHASELRLHGSKYKLRTVAVASVEIANRADGAVRRSASPAFALIGFLPPSRSIMLPGTSPWYISPWYVYLPLVSRDHNRCPCGCQPAWAHRSWFRSTCLRASGETSLLG